MNSLYTSEGHVCALPLQEEDAYSLQSHTHLFAKLRNQRRQDSVQINALRRPLIEDPPDAVKRAGAPLGGDCVAEILHHLAFGRRVGVSPSLHTESMTHVNLCGATTASAIFYILFNQ